MTTAHRNRPTRAWTHDQLPVMVARSALVGMLIGAAPGAILVLLAQYVIAGEMQLTVGAPGIVLAVIGAAAGLVLGGLRAWRQRAGRSSGH